METNTLASAAYAGSIAVIPWNPAFWVIQIPIFIIIVLLCIFWLGNSVKRSALIGYLAQMPITSVIAFFGFSLFLKYSLKL